MSSIVKLCTYAGCKNLARRQGQRCDRHADSITASPEPERFIATFDIHVGFEHRHGRVVPLHDPQAWSVVMQFAQDFKPHHWIVGGDALDCGEISHHNKMKPRRTEGFRLLRSAEYCHKEVITPIEEVTSHTATFIKGNHEDWVEDLLDADPALEGIVNLEKLLHLDKWKVVEQGGCHQLGKLHFIHGDQISGGVYAARNAVDAYMENVRLGHFHTFQVATKTSAVGNVLGKTGMVVPCMCGKDPRYNEGRPNRWVQGFLYGYVMSDGSFHDFVAIILQGQTVVNGKVYRG